MSGPIEPQVVSAIGPLVGSRLYPGAALWKQQTPYATYHIMNNKPEVCLDNTIPLNNTRLQVDVYSDEYSDVRSVTDALYEALLTAGISCVPILEGADFDAETKQHRITTDFSIWF